MLYNFGCAILRAVGDTKVTMRTNVTANLVNVSLNAILINGLLGFPAMGVVGAAIATFCGAVVSTIMAIAAVLKKGGYYRSIELSKEYGLYRQDFCGCKYSKRKGV